MINPIIKICGICDPVMSAQAALAGAHFIGVIFHPLSPRYVSLEQAAAIAAAATQAGAIPVAVFVDHSAVEMRKICEITHIQTVQLHGANARQQHHLLPEAYQRIYVQHVAEDGTLLLDEGLQYLNAKRDLLLIDHMQPGQGNTIKPFFHYDLPFPWLLAGGLTSTNVVAAMQTRQPNGVDVSSGVESSRGHKDIGLIQQFIQTVLRSSCINQH